MRAVESRVVNGADVVWACSETDAAQLAASYGRRAEIAVVPNGVDLGAYSPDAASIVGDWSREPVTLLYVGSFGYGPNADAAMRLISDVLPAVRARGHDVRVILAGRSPSPAMLAAARQDTDIEVTGHVESTLPYLRRRCVVALPIAVGSRTRLKILEAFAAGRPVVTTAKGAEGLDAIEGRHLLLREDPEAFAEAVLELWHRPLLRANLCAEALALVRARYSWSVAAEAIAQSLGQPLVARGDRGPSMPRVPAAS